MRKKPTRKRPYFKMESAMTVILRDASGKMHHGIPFDPPLTYLMFENELYLHERELPIWIFMDISMSKSGFRLPLLKSIL